MISIAWDGHAFKLFVQDIQYGINCGTLSQIINFRSKVVYNYWAIDIWADDVSYVYASDIGNEYSKRWVDSNHTHNFWYLYAFILILNTSTTLIQSLKYSFYSYLTIRMMLLTAETHRKLWLFRDALEAFESHVD